ncbi:MAG: glycosyltransferase family 4 protein [Rhizobiales bacterium]|nr:glycosyltransferase family 4 protein [Hyphomicrobiales bacterium]
MAKTIAIVLKGYPRLSESFIAQEILSLERAGLTLMLISMRHPTDGKVHPVHREIRSPVRYLPEYLHDEPWRVFKAFIRAQGLPGYWKALPTFLRDLWCEPNLHRLRRIGQALVLVTEIDPEIAWLHAHFIHTPASVTQYASLMTGIGWSCSAHAKDIWTTRDDELKRKLDAMAWTVTCTRAGYLKLQSLASNPQKVHLSYHGLDLDRFGVFSGSHSNRDGSNPNEPVVILSVGRAVAKKGYDVLLDALARLPPGLSWRCVHVGGGELLKPLKDKAKALGIDTRIDWLGSQAQEDVLARYRSSDLFVLACRIADDGDRDGLPNVLVEASSQALPCISTRVSGVTELLENDVTGLVVEPDDPDALAKELLRAITQPELRRRLSVAAEALVRNRFDHHASVGELVRLLEASLSAEAKP